jgi:hypothetical protein
MQNFKLKYKQFIYDNIKDLETMKKFFEKNIEEDSGALYVFFF